MRDRREPVPSHRRSGIALRVGQAEHRPARPHVLIELRGDLVVAVWELDDDETVDREHLLERRAVRDTGLLLDDPAQAVALHQVRHEAIVTGGAEYEEKLFLTDRASVE